jgi:hypothetical protein
MSDDARDMLLVGELKRNHFLFRNNLTKGDLKASEPLSAMLSRCFYLAAHHHVVANNHDYFTYSAAHSSYITIYSDFRSISQPLEDHPQRRSLHSNSLAIGTILQHKLVQRQPISLEKINSLLPTNTSRRSRVYERIFVLDHSTERSLVTTLKTSRVQSEVNFRHRVDTCSLCDLCQPIRAIDVQLNDSEAGI